MKDRDETIFALKAISVIGVICFLILAIGCAPAPFSPAVDCAISGAVIHHRISGDFCKRDEQLVTIAGDLLSEYGLATESEVSRLLAGREIWVDSTYRLPWSETITVEGLYYAGWPGSPIVLAREMRALEHELIHAVREELRDVSNDDELVHRGWCLRANAAGQCLTSDGIRDASGDSHREIADACMAFAKEVP